MRRRLYALLVALSLVFVAAVVLHASEGPYNTDPMFCRNNGPLNPYWWWPAQCMYPDPPWASGAD